MYVTEDMVLRKRLWACAAGALLCASNVLGSTNIVSDPVGFVRIQAPPNSETLVSMPFYPFDPNVSGLLRGQLTGATNESLADSVRKWDTSTATYTNAYKADNTGVPSRDGLWFTDFSSWATSDLSIKPGEGFWVRNNHVGTQDVYLCGELVLDGTGTVSVAGGFNLLSYPFAARIGLNETMLRSSGGQGGTASTNADVITDPFDNGQYWLVSDTNSPLNGLWVDTLGNAAGLEFVLGRGYWYQGRSMTGFDWSEPRPYEATFSINGEPPRIVSMTPGSNGACMTLGIAPAGDSGERLEVYWQDVAATGRFVATNWCVAATNLLPSGTNLLSWTDSGAADRAPVNSVYVRCYLVGRGDLDHDGDNLPDGREQYVLGTNPDNADTDGDGYTDGAEVAAGSDPRDSNSVPDDIVGGRIGAGNYWTYWEGSYIYGVIHYDGPQAGLIWVEGTGAGYEHTSAIFVETPGSYCLDVPYDDDWSVAAWRDSNNNYSMDPWEAQGTYILNPIFAGGDAYDIDITLVDPDTDTNGIPDWWEVTYFGGPGYYDPQGDADADGLSNYDEYQYGTDPWNADSDGDGSYDGYEVQVGTDPTDVASYPVGINGTISYEGPQTGLVWVVAVGESNTWEMTHAVSNEAPGTYVNDVPNGSNSWWVKAWRDSNGDTTNDPWEAYGEYTNPVAMTANTYGVDFALADPDTDTNGIPDWWEVRHFGGVGSYNPDADADGDGILNAGEFQYGTDPWDADTDDDGRSDLAEVQAGMDPLDPNSFPAVISGTIAYSGRQTGLVWIAAFTDWYARDPMYVKTVQTPGAYAISNVPNGQSYWVVAWRDSNGNTNTDFWEAYGEFSGNTLYLSNDTANVDVTLADPDTDMNGLPDWWEIRYSGWVGYWSPYADQDGDGVVNYDEYLYEIEPLVADTDHDGFLDGADNTPLSRAYIPWGDPFYTSGDSMVYPWPVWMVSAGKAGGDWDTNDSAWRVSNTSTGGASLHIAVDRAVLTNDLRMALSGQYGEGASLHLDLCATNGTVVAEDVLGNLLEGLAADATNIVIVPLMSYPTAARLQLRHGTGDVSVVSTLLYVDEDDDGLDRDQESQLGTSDSQADSDEDGVDDLQELRRGTDPLDPESRNVVVYADSDAGSDEYDGLAATFEGEHGPKASLGAALAASYSGDTIQMTGGNAFEETSLILGGKVLLVRPVGQVTVRP